MKTAFRQVSLITTLEAEEAASVILQQVFGQQPSVFIHPEREESVLSVYLTDKQTVTDANRYAVSEALKMVQESGLDPGPGHLEVKRLRREDWVDSWKGHFKPIHIGGKLLLKPSWCKDKPSAGQKVVILDPGLSFGTGQHATTKFCLNQLAVLRDKKRKQSFLDIGTGSGILAIAAAKLGYRPVKAIDYDSEAVRVAKRNALRNRVDNHLQIRQGDVNRLSLKARAKYDVVCANLFYDLLIANASRIIARVKLTGALVLSGILDRQFDEVREVFKGQRMCLDRARKQREWRSGRFVFADR